MKNYRFLVVFLILLTGQSIDQLQAATNNSQQIESHQKEEAALNNLKAVVAQKDPATLLKVLDDTVIKIAQDYSDAFHKELANIVSQEQSQQTTAQSKTTQTLLDLGNFIKKIQNICIFKNCFKIIIGSPSKCIAYRHQFKPINTHVDWFIIKKIS
jgi:hypothetical protein